MQLCGFNVGLDQRFFLIAGTCSIEGLEMSLDVAGQLKEACTALGIPLIYKGSFDKANRSSGTSKRGVGLQFGPDVTKRFCEKNGLEAIIRSHEVRMEGWEAEHDSRCYTVFSAPNYCDSTGNKGAFINIENDYKLQFQKFDAVPHPDIKPMVSRVVIGKLQYADR